MRKAQGSLEYLVIIAVVLLVAGIVVYVVSGSAGNSVSSINFEQCKTAANQCRTNHLVNAHDPCNFCEKACTVNGKDILEGTGFSAVELCKQGNVSEIYLHKQIGCGNGVIEGSEVCDGANLSGNTCESLGFTGGTLGCKSDCSDYDYTFCTHCGDNIIQQGELCDGTDLNGRTCADFADFDKGELSCLSDCTGFNTSKCSSYECGNGEVEPGEDCEPSPLDLNGETCESRGYDGGNLGCSNECLFDESNCDYKPTASFSTDCWHLDCDFDASASTDSDGSIVKYNWDFGDGNITTTTEPTVHHHFTGSNEAFKDETYTVKLNVTDDKGLDSDYAVNDSVYVTTNYAPSSSISYTWNKLHDYSFTGGYSDPEGTDASAYSWDFRDGSTSTEQNPSHTYSEVPKAYSVKYTVTDGGGRSTTVYKTVYSNNEPNPDFTYSCDADTFECTFTDASDAGFYGVYDSDEINDYVMQYYWDFDGDGQPDTYTENPSYTFDSGGDYDVNLTVADRFVLKNTIVKTVHIPYWHSEVISNTGVVQQHKPELMYDKYNGLHIYFVADSDSLKAVSKTSSGFSDPSLFSSSFGSFSMGNFTFIYENSSDYKVYCKQGFLGNPILLDSLSPDLYSFSADLGGDNKFYASYTSSNSGDLMYVYNDSSGWHVFTLDSDSDYFGTSIKVDSVYNYPHIAYYDTTNHDLNYKWYGYLPGGTVGWQTKIVDSTGDVGSTPSLTLSNGYARIVYVDKTNGYLKYAKENSDGTWTTEVIPGTDDIVPYSIGSYIISSYDKGAVLYVSYPAKNGDIISLKVAVNENGEWHVHTVDSKTLQDIGLFSSIIVDSNGLPVVVYKYQDNLKYAEYY